MVDSRNTTCPLNFSLVQEEDWWRDSNRNRRKVMASVSGLDLKSELRSHEVAIAELNNLPSGRTVYQKNGNLFFRTTVQTATNTEQKQLDSAKAKLKNLNVSS
ncbi:Prefoldin chaperone subunit family protein [Trifolium repens]|nr:Prefoldin chaperone subunit family protein [Trifolium repens]